MEKEKITNGAEAAEKINTRDFEESTEKYREELNRYRQLGIKCAGSAEQAIKSAGFNPAGFHVVQDTCQILKTSAEKASNLSGNECLDVGGGLAFMHCSEEEKLTYSVFTEVFADGDGDFFVEASLRRTDETGGTSDIFRDGKWVSDEQSEMAKAVRFTHSLNRGQKLIALFMARMSISSNVIEKNVMMLKPLGAVAEKAEDAGVNVQVRSMTVKNSKNSVICLAFPELDIAVTMNSHGEFQIFAYDERYNAGFSGIRNAERIDTAMSVDGAVEKLLFRKMSGPALAA